MLKTLFKRKHQKSKVEPAFPSLDERPLFDKPTLNTLTFQIEGMLQQNERQLPIQATLYESLQHYMAQSDQNLAIHQLQFTSAHVIFFPDKENTVNPHATKVYLDIASPPLHIGYVPAQVSAQLIDIINGKKARSFQGTFHEVQNDANGLPSYIFQIEIQHI